jgi:maltoporin
MALTLTVLLPAVAHGQQDGFGFQGYFRSGFGVAGTGDPQEAFRAPNAGAKYRLGNETEAYLETIFGYGVRPKDDSTTFFDTRINISYVTPTSNTNSFETTIALREAFVVAAGVQIETSW